MTLRLRLVLALLTLVTFGLVIFGTVTYSLYARSLYQRIDDQLRNSVPLVTSNLRAAAGIGESPFQGGPGGANFAGPDHDGNGPGGPVLAPAGTYAELRNPDGDVVPLSFGETSGKPKLPDDLHAPAHGGSLRTVDSTSGSGRWRVYVTAADRPHGDTVVVATPLQEVSASLDRLVAIEVVSGLVLLAMLGTGSWFILRRGLRPLEQMADQARSINAERFASGNVPSDLAAERMSPSDDRTEVGQLGLAINTMLAEIEEAFRERDVTEHRLRQFLADASHELRTPLTSIQGFAELFRLGAEDDRVQLEVIFRRIEEESARMKTLVEDLLLLARLDETRPAERNPVDLAVLAADACSDAVATSPDRPITLDAPEPVVVPGDRDHLRQAIANLVTNALRHTPDGTAIEVGARIVDGAAEVTVRDHGAGLDPDTIDHVFDRFWQADRARVGSGTGLGLSIVAGIAEEHHGSVSASNVDGKGACFRIRLPLDFQAGESSARSGEV
jgi:two-component system, OmpR family, sensor kinase